MTHHQLQLEAKSLTSSAVASGLITFQPPRQVSIRTIQKQKQKAKLAEAQAKLASLRIVSPA